MSVGTLAQVITANSGAEVVGNPFFPAPEAAAVSPSMVNADAAATAAAALASDSASATITNRQELDPLSEALANSAG